MATVSNRETEFKYDLVLPQAPNVLGSDLSDAYKAAAEFITLYHCAIDGFNVICRPSGLANSDEFAKAIPLIHFYAKYVLETFDRIELSESLALAPIYLLHEIRSARAKLTTRYRPDKGDHSIRAIRAREFPSAFDYLGSLVPLLSGIVAHTCLHIVGDKHEGCEFRSYTPEEFPLALARLGGMIELIPVLETPQDVANEVLRELIAVEQCRRDGKSWETLEEGIEDENDRQNLAMAKIDSAYEFIVSNGPVKAVLVARHLEITEKSFYRHYSKPLKARGVKNLGKGYFVPT